MTLSWLAGERAAATALAAIVIVLMTLGGGALITEHVSLLDQRDTLKEASNAAAIAATLELKRLLADDPNVSDADLKAALDPLARGFIVANLLHLNDARLAQAKKTLVVEVKSDRDQRTVDVTAKADLGGFFFSEALPFLSGVDRIESITTKARVEMATNPIEVVLAIDVSFSMKVDLEGKRVAPVRGNTSRMDVVKQAANDLVDILDPDADRRVAVGVVPWHILVRLDETARKEWDSEGWAAYPSSRHYAAPYACDPEDSCTAPAADQNLPAAPGEDWQGCLDEHRVSGGSADLPSVSDLLDHPKDSAFAQAIFPTLQGVAYECLQPPVPTNVRYQSCYGAEGTNVPKVYGGTAAQRGCAAGARWGEAPNMLPLSTDRAAIEAAIDALEPVGIRTYSTLGVAWGQRLLSHDWNDVWGGGTHPVDPDDDDNAGARKAIVLLTDGEDNQCGTKDPTCATNDVGFARSVACTAAKAEGTEIFVVTAMHPDKVSDDLATRLRDCSSDGDADSRYVFLNNATAERLEAAFADIANQLVTVRRVY